MHKYSTEAPARFPRRRFVVSSGLATAGLFLHGPPAAANPASPDLDAFIQAQMDSAHVPGLSLAIIQDGKLQRSAAFGSANLAQKRPMRADTLINIGSVTKTITCTAVMQLWERKKFALDDDVNASLSFPVRNPAHPNVPITFRQLLTHTSSIADGPAYGKSYACGDSRIPLEQWLRDYLKPAGALYHPQHNFHPSNPGTQFRYSNVAFGLLGHLIESLSGMSYSDYILKNIFAPLGMSQSRFLMSGMNPHSHATPYTYAKQADVAGVVLREPAWTPPAAQAERMQVPHCLYSFGTPPDGLARTNAVELSRFVRAYINGGELDGGRVLRSETITQVLSSQEIHLATAKSQMPEGHGLTWRPTNLGTGMIWGHTGSDPGISTLIAFRPQDRRGVVVLTNGSEGYQVAKEIGRRLLAA